MRFLKIFFSLMLTILLVSVLLTSCGGSSAGGDTTNGDGGTTAEDPHETTEEPETELVIVIVPTPSLSREEEVEEIGIRVGDTIISCKGTFGGGSVYDGTNDAGRPLWKSAEAELWPIDPGVIIPEGFPTVVIAPGAEIAIVNNAEYEVTLTNYMDYASGLNFGPTVPTATGTYLLHITVTSARPGLSDPLPEKGAKFGNWNFFAVVSVEE